MNEWFNATDGRAIYLVTIVLILGGEEIGAAFARRSRNGTTNDADRFLSSLATPSIGLLALIIGFTFSMALSRFEARRSAVLSEANAIGTAALRGQMLPEPYRSTVAPLFKEYAMILYCYQCRSSGITEDHASYQAVLRNPGEAVARRHGSSRSKSAGCTFRIICSSAKYND